MINDSSIITSSCAARSADLGISSINIRIKAEEEPRNRSQNVQGEPMWGLHHDFWGSRLTCLEGSIELNYIYRNLVFQPTLESPEFYSYYTVAFNSKIFDVSFFLLSKATENLESVISDIENFSGSFQSSLDDLAVDAIEFMEKR